MDVDTSQSTPSARERLIYAAERLIAAQGLDISLREVALSADQGNHSAVQYYFGSRDGLVDGIIDYRTAPLEAERMAMLADAEVAGRGNDRRTLVGLLAIPLARMARDQPSYYLRFLVQVRNHVAVTDMARHERRRPVVRLVTARIADLLGDLAPQARRRRLETFAITMFALLAEHERRIEDLAPAPEDVELLEAELLDVLVGVLTAPAYDLHASLETPSATRMVER